MDDNTLKNLQKYLEFIRFNTTDFGIRLLRQFSVSAFSVQKNRYRVVMNPDNLNDVYWVEVSDLNKFLSGKLCNKVILRLGNAFNEEGKAGYYMSLTENKMEADEEALQILYGLRFKLNDIFYKIENLNFKNLPMPNGEESIMDDNIKIYVVEDFKAIDFLEVNKFENTSKAVKKGMGYSIEIDGEHSDDYVLLSDAKSALKLTKRDACSQIIEDLEAVFPLENKISNKVISIIKNRLINDL